MPIMVYRNSLFGKLTKYTIPIYQNVNTSPFKLFNFYFIQTIDQIKEVSKINDFSLSYTSESSSSKNPSPFCTKETFKSAYSGVSSFIKKLEEVNESEKKSSVTSQFNVDEMYSIAQKSFAMSKGTTMKQILESNGKLNDSSSIIFNSENYLEKDVNKVLFQNIIVRRLFRHYIPLTQYKVNP